MTARPASARFWAKVDRRGPAECWIWLGHHRMRFHVEGNFMTEARRFSWFLAHGHYPPKNRDVEVTCKNSLCVNPDHLDCPSLEEKFWRQIDTSGGPE